MRRPIRHVFVTGVAGFIGSNLLDYLLDNTEWQVSGHDNLSTGRIDNIADRLSNPRFSFHECDIRSIDSLQSVDCVFHLAALPRIQPSFDHIVEHIEHNLCNSAHLLELMVRDKHFPRIVYSGSSAVYGTPTTTPTPESERIDCLSPYAFQKYEFERYLELLSTRYPIDYATLRYFNPYGPRSFNPDNTFNAYSSVVGIFLARRAAGKPLLITGDGRQQRDFVHVKDIARANYLAAVHDGNLNTAFNIGHGDTLSVLDLAHKISTEWEFIAKREGESQITFADTSKAQRVLGWTPIHSLDDYIREVVS